MKGAFDKLKQVSPQETPKQKVVPVKKSRRENESSYTLWLDKDLLKALKLKAIEEEDNVKNLVEKAVRQYLDGE
jgi:protein tyrosine/serine phosphatase